MKILITGGAGFIGANFVHYMLKKYPQYDIVVVDALTYAGNLDTINNVLDLKKIKFYKADITNIDQMDSIFSLENFDIVINFAAESHVDRSIDNPSIFLKTNILGTQVLMDKSLQYNVKRFHQVSTDEVYGDLPLDRPDLLFKENTPLKTSSPYSASKASADLLALSYYKTFGLPLTISRCSNNYGPYQFPEKLIPLMIKRALSNEPLPVYGEGKNIRDWLHVYDHCTAIDLIIHSGIIGEVYNIGGNNERSNLEIVNAILNEIGKPVELIKFVTDRKGHDLRYAIDSSKITKELGWKPVYSLNVGLKETIKWYIENQAWVENIVSGDYLVFMKKKYGND